MKEKLELSVSTVAFISCRRELRLKLADITRWGSVERESDGGGRAGWILAYVYSENFLNCWKSWCALSKLVAGICVLCIETNIMLFSFFIIHKLSDTMGCILHINLSYNIDNLLR